MNRTVRPAYDLPLTFRAEVVKPIMHCVAAGDSCSIVGIGSVGKSNLLRFLQREGVRRAYLDNEWNACLFVHVDVNKMLKRSLWGLSELMLHQLMIELTNQGADEAALETVDDLHRKATEPKTRYLALRYLDRAVGIACNRLGLRLVFLFDEFDDLCRTMSPHGFAALRALRDDYKYQLMYVVATRLELNRLPDEIAEIEAFEELVSPNTIYLGPYSEADARFMLHRLEARHNIRLNDEIANRLLAATGGHPGLLRAAYQAAIKYPSDLSGALALSPQVQDECRRIWLSLVPDEQRVIASLASDTPVGEHQADVLELLRHKRMIGGPWTDQDLVFSPLFAEYIKQQRPLVGAYIHVDRKRRIVWVGSRAIRGLSRLEYKFIAYLEEKRGQVCSRDELAQHLYPDDMSPKGAGVTNARLDAVVKRVRKRIEPLPGKPQYIVTVRGHGFRLADGDEGTA